MLKHLPKKSLQTLLIIFNNIWETGEYPETWRLATIVPIPKPGKDHAEPTNYRPIALTSCLCKTLERMINKRLVWYLDDDDEFRFNDASTHEGHLRQNGELTWFCSETIIMISHKCIKCKTRTNLKIKAVILC